MNEESQELEAKFEALGEQIIDLQGKIGNLEDEIVQRIHDLDLLEQEAGYIEDLINDAYRQARETEDDE